MIELYLWTTPNGRKPVIMLEETGLEYTLKPVRLNGEQHSPEYLRINPNGKIPALIDKLQNGEQVTVFESGAILIYLAEKMGQFLPAAGQARASVIEWLMFQMSSVGPYFGQLGHFRGVTDKDVTYAVERFHKEAKRLYRVMDGRLAEVDYLAGDYSIADMATYPWAHDPGRLDIALDDYPHFKRWVVRVGERPAVQKAMNLRLS